MMLFLLVLPSGWFQAQKLLPPHNGRIKVFHIRSSDSNLSTEKFHRYLSRELLFENVASSRLDAAGLAQLARRVVGDDR